MCPGQQNVHVTNCSVPVFGPKKTLSCVLGHLAVSASCNSWAALSSNDWKRYIASTRAGAASKHGILWARVNLERRRRPSRRRPTAHFVYPTCMLDRAPSLYSIIVDGAAGAARAEAAHCAYHSGGGKRASDQARAHYDFMSI